jgi:hypothetical protein
MIFNVMIFVATINGRTKFFPHPPGAVVVSRIQDLEWIKIRILDPG